MHARNFIESDCTIPYIRILIGKKEMESNKKQEKGLAAALEAADGSNMKLEHYSCVYEHNRIKGI